MEPLTLKQAAERYRLKVTTLRARVRDGSLVVYQPGREFLTTPEHVEAMIESCRVKPARTSTSTDPAPHGASGMALDQSELDAVLATRLAPKNGLGNTSPASTGRHRRPAPESETCSLPTLNIDLGKSTA
jgi:hypothetical protein